MMAAMRSGCWEKCVSFQLPSTVRLESLVCLVPSQGSMLYWTGARAEIMSSQSLCLGKGCMRSISCAYTTSILRRSLRVSIVLFLQSSKCIFFYRVEEESIWNNSSLDALFLSFWLAGEFSKWKVLQKEKKFTSISLSVKANFIN